MEVFPLDARICLRSQSRAVPDAGLSVSPLRVELMEEGKPGVTWIAEIRVVGDLPWFKGEERCVNVRIMSEQFRKYVHSNKPNLLVSRGLEVVGDLTFDIDGLPNSVSKA
jgi:hypothetical protein